MRSFSVGLALSLAAVIGSSGVGASEPAVVVPPGWQRSPQDSFTIPAGGLCAFTLQADVVRDEVVTRVLETWPDGSPRNQAYAGALVYRFSNVERGVAVTRNVSGDALVHWGQDGSASWDYVGPVAVAFFGSPLAAGLWILDGLFVVDYSVAGAQTLPVHQGHEENLCATLAP
jgi:hypothetical protein